MSVIELANHYLGVDSRRYYKGVICLGFLTWRGKREDIKGENRGGVKVINKIRDYSNTIQHSTPKCH